MVAPGAAWMPIGELSRRVGVSTDVLRKWERRYGVLEPRRTSGNHRLYSRVDEARVRLMLTHVRGGVAPSQAAELAVAARFRITSTATSGADARESTSAIRLQMLAALRRWDETAAEQVLERSLSTLSRARVIREVLLPLAADPEPGSQREERAVAERQFAAGFVYARLLAIARGWDRGLGPPAVLACLRGEEDAVGLIAFGIVLHQIGWRITYLAGGVSVRALAETADAVDARLVVVHAHTPQPLHVAAADLRRLAERRSIGLIGPGAGDAVATPLGARHLAGDPVSAAESILP